MEQANPDLSSMLIAREATEKMQSLLAQMAEQESAQAEQAQDQQKHQKHFYAYDFANPVSLSANEMRKLRARHSQYISSLAARLSIYLRLEVNLQLTRFEAIPCKQFIAELQNAQLSLFKAEPLRGTCFLNLNTGLALVLVDRLMGGRGQPSGTERDLTEVEAALLEQVTQLIIGEWCGHWSDFQELRPALFGHESGHYLPAAHMDSHVVVLSAEAHVGDCAGQIHFGFPYPALEPLARHLRQKLDVASGEGAQLTEAQPKWDPRFNNVRILLKAEWPAIQLSARRIAGLKSGDIIEWDPEMASKVRLRLPNATRFIGRLGTKNKKWAVELIEVLKPD
jgi:flagellar motor switch protein FliM